MQFHNYDLGATVLSPYEGSRATEDKLGECSMLNVLKSIDTNFSSYSSKAAHSHCLFQLTSVTWSLSLRSFHHSVNQAVHLVLPLCSSYVLLQSQVYEINCIDFHDTSMPIWIQQSTITTVFLIHNTLFSYSPQIFALSLPLPSESYYLNSLCPVIIWIHSMCRYLRLVPHLFRVESHFKA